MTTQVIQTGSTVRIIVTCTGGTPTPSPTPSPAFSVQPSITGTPQIGVGFVGTPGTASNTTSHTYRWLISATSGGTYTAIGGATGTSYTPVSGDETKYLKFEDTATGPTAPPAVATTTFAGPVAAIDAPVLSNLTSGWTTGDNPPNWDTAYSGIYYDDTDFTGDGLRIRYKFAGAGSYTTMPWIPFDVTYLSDGFTYAFLTDGTLNAGGAFEVQVQVGRDFSAAIPSGTPTTTSGWSNSWTDTLSAIASGLTTAYRSSATHNDGYGAASSFTGLTTYSGKKHIVMITSRGGVGPTAVSLDGNAMTQPVASLVTSNKTVSVWVVNITTGGTGKTLAITQSSAETTGYGMWTTDSTATYVSSASKAYAYTPDPQVTSGSITMPSGGAIFVGAMSEDSGNITANSPTSEDADTIEATSGYRHFFGRQSATGVASVSNGNNLGCMILAVAYQP